MKHRSSPDHSGCYRPHQSEKRQLFMNRFMDRIRKQKDLIRQILLEVFFLQRCFWNTVSVSKKKVRQYIMLLKRYWTKVTEQKILRPIKSWEQKNWERRFVPKLNNNYFFSARCQGTKKFSKTYTNPKRRRLKIEVITIVTKTKAIA